MSGAQRWLSKCIRKRVSRHLYREYSNTADDQKDKNAKSVKNTDKSKENVDSSDKKEQEFKDFNCFLPERKGNVNVCIIGGSKVALYTAILIKQSRLIKRVHLVDAKDSVSGAILDAGHIDTSTRLKYFKKNRVVEALKESNIVALMDETDAEMTLASPKAQFDAAAAYAHSMAERMVKVCSESLIAVFVRPVTAILPMISELYKVSGWWDPDKIIGSTSFDRMRMEAITANLLDLNPAFLSVPMVGGADPYTIVPLLSRTSPTNAFTNAQQDMMLQSFRCSDQHTASLGLKQPTLSPAAAAARLILALADGLSGYPNVITSAYVRSNVMPACKFFTTEIQFGTGGVEKNFGMPKMSATELIMIEQAIPYIAQFSNWGVEKVFRTRRTLRNAIE